MHNSELVDFVRSSLSAGASKTQTAQALLDAGWTEAEIRGALDSFADGDFLVPVPVPKAQISAREAFLYLVMFGMLYLSTYQFGSLVFDFINLALPDPINNVPRSVIGSSIRFSVATLVVAFPLFLLTATRLTKIVARDPVRRDSPIRKWLTYLTLAASAFIIVGDLILTLYNLLSGELTLRFLLKAVTIGALSSGVFYFYLWTMRVDDEVLNR